MITKSLEKELAALEESGFHGNVTINYADGKPKKIRVEKVKDLK